MSPKDPHGPGSGGGQGDGQDLAVSDNGDGTYAASYNPQQRKGTDLIAINLDGVPISGSPFTNTVHWNTGVPPLSALYIPLYLPLFRDWMRASGPIDNGWNAPGDRSNAPSCGILLPSWFLTTPPPACQLPK